MADKVGFDKPLYVPSTGDAKADIVFVHGLGGNRIDTWTSEPTKQVPLKTFWPKDLLPKQCPTARILSFGYDSHFVSFFRKQLAQEVTIDNYSTALCQHLASLRETTNTPADRPIIYVAHSLGGLVAANAVSRTQGANEAAKKLADNTVGMIFLGTPFAGSDKARWGGIGVGLANLLGLKTKDTDIEDLKEGSAKLTEINRNFKNLIKERDRNHELRKLEVVCYFEEHPTYVARKHLGSMVSIGKIVDKDSAGDIQADMLSIADNHSDMCKFGAEYLAGYQSVSGQLVQWIKALDRKIDKDGKNKKGDVVEMKVLSNDGVAVGIIKSEPGGRNTVTGQVRYNIGSSASQGKSAEELVRLLAESKMMQERD